MLATPRSVKMLVARVRIFGGPIALAITGGSALHAGADPIEPHEVRVTDGDTIRIFNMTPNLRLVGFNAQETRHVQCEAERELGAPGNPPGPRPRQSWRPGLRACRVFVPHRHRRNHGLQLGPRVRDAQSGRP
jgi:endonuclease YncB( thermonuclease family)